MFRNYIITALRNLKKDSFFSIINILGLTVGITVFIVIMLFVLFENVLL